MSEHTEIDSADAPVILRKRHELRRRTLTVAKTERVTPVMIRLTLEGAELEGFVSDGPDDHIKIFVPTDTGEDARRDYTPRAYDETCLLLDVVDHPGGPVADWARDVRPGDQVTIGGPRGSQVVSGPIAEWLLIGDETALPAIGRRIEELDATASVTSLVAIPGPQDEQAFETLAAHAARWLHRPASEATDPAPFLTALDQIDIRPNTYVWVAAEAGVAKAIRTRLIEKGVPARWIKASGYWVAGEADASVKSMED